MSDLPTPGEPALTKFGIGLTGSLVSLKFVPGTLLEKFGMAFGGAVLSFLSASWVAAKLHMSDAEGLVGFMLGLLGMAIVTKMYETVQGVDTKAISKAFVDMIKRVLGV